MHGGVAGKPRAKPQWRLAERPDSSLTAKHVGRLIVHVDSAANEGPLPYANVVLHDEKDRWYWGTADSVGLAIVNAPTGRYLARIRMIGFNAWADSIAVREGMSDTLHIGLGTPSMCLT